MSRAEFHNRFLRDNGLRWSVCHVADGDGKIFVADMEVGKLQVTFPPPSVTWRQLNTDAAGRSNPDFLNLGGGNLNSATQVLTPGLYRWGSGVTIAESVTLDGQGDSNAVWIFQVQNRLAVASSAEILLSGNANPANIFWQTAEGATIGTNAHFIGNILTMTTLPSKPIPSLTLI